MAMHVLIPVATKLRKGDIEFFTLKPASQMHPDPMKWYLLPGANQVHALNVMRNLSKQQQTIDTDKDLGLAMFNLSGLVFHGNGSEH